MICWFYKQYCTTPKLIPIFFIAAKCRRAVRKAPLTGVYGFPLGRTQGPCICTGKHIDSEEVACSPYCSGFTTLIRACTTIPHQRMICLLACLIGMRVLFFLVAMKYFPCFYYENHTWGFTPRSMSWFAFVFCQLKLPTHLFSHFQGLSSTFIYQMSFRLLLCLGKNACGCNNYRAGVFCNFLLTK